AAGLGDLRGGLDDVRPDLVGDVAGQEDVQAVPHQLPGHERQRVPGGLAERHAAGGQREARLGVDHDVRGGLDEPAEHAHGEAGDAAVDDAALQALVQLGVGDGRGGAAQRLDL